MSDENVILQVEDLNVHYRDLQALYGVSLSVKKGSIVSIIGSNGAGKSTLLGAITGINKPTSGRIVFNGAEVGGKLTSKIVAKGVTMSPEGSRIFERMTVMENLLLGAYLPKARKKKDESLQRVFSLFPVLSEKSKQPATFLSGGQRQMLSIARALMADPQVVLCDEVSLGLAPIVIKDIYEKIREINRDGMTFILVEQDVRRSLKYSDYSYVMIKGKIVMEGPSVDLLKIEDEVKDAYFGINKYA
jgi:branched-chain amino acid transport system ATP-binding protein